MLLLLISLSNFHSLFFLFVMYEYCEIIWTLVYSIINKWLSSFFGQCLVAVTVNGFISVYIYIYIPVCFSHVTGSALSCHLCFLSTFSRKPKFLICGSVLGLCHIFFLSGK